MRALIFDNIIIRLAKLSSEGTGDVQDTGFSLIGLDSHTDFHHRLSDAPLDEDALCELGGDGLRRPADGNLRIFAKCKAAVQKAASQTVRSAPRFGASECTGRDALSPDTRGGRFFLAVDTNTRLKQDIYGGFWRTLSVALKIRKYSMLRIYHLTQKFLADRLQFLFRNRYYNDSRLSGKSKVSKKGIAAGVLALRDTHFLF